MPKKIKLATPAQEPVDIKGAMIPVTGNSTKIDLSKYKTVTSNNANVFYVIGSLPNGLVLSFRVWKEASDHGTTLLGLRLRVGDHPDGESASAKALQELAHMKCQWTTAAGTISHKSLMGQVFVNANAWEPASVAKAVIDAGYLGELLLAIQKYFPTSTDLTSDHDFIVLFVMLTAIALQDVTPPFKKAGPAQYLYFGSASSPIIDTKAVTADTYIATTKPVGYQIPDAKPETPQPFAAPHPKDKLKTSDQATKTAPKASKTV